MPNDRFLLTLVANLFFVPCVLAATTFEVNPITGQWADTIIDVSNAGTITGVSVTLTGTICTSYANDGALTTDAAGNVVCSDDDTGGTLNSFETWDVPVGGDIVADSSTDTVTFTSTGPVVIFGTTASDSIAWNLQDSSLTEVMLKVVDTPADEECLTYETTDGDFEWQTCGSGGNSFETWAVPEGASIVADSSTDTATFTSTGPIVVFGTAGSDEIALNIHDNGITSSMIADNAVALTTDTTGNYVASVGNCTAGEGSACFDGSDGTILTSTTSETINMATDATFTFTRNNAGAVTIIGADNAGNANTIYDTTAGGTVQIGSADVGGITLATGNATIVSSGGTYDFTYTPSTGTLTYGQISGCNGPLCVGTQNSGQIDLWSTPDAAGILTNVYGGTYASKTSVVNGDNLAFLEGEGYNASAADFTRAGSLYFVADGEYATGSDTTDSPGRMEVWTTPDGSSTQALRLTINNDGNTTVGSSGTDLALLSVDGDEDEAQFIVQANATQTSPLFVVEKSTGTNLAEVTATGVLVVGADTATGVLVLYDGTNGRTVRLTPSTSMTQDTYYTLPVDDGTASQFLQTDGSGTLTWATSSGSGDITDVFNCSTGDCASIAAGATDLLDFSGVDASTTSEGLILPQIASACAAATAEGQICWDTAGDDLYVGSGAAAVQMNGGGADTNADKEFVWPMSALLPLEAADSIPPIAKDAGTNVDMLPVDFDQSTDECRTFTFIVPPDITSGGTVTFTVAWYSASVTTNNVVWDVRHNSGVAEGVDPDQAVTTESAAADAVQGTAGQITVTTWTETQTNLAWVASDMVVGVVCRDADNGSDNFAADARAILFGIRIPRS